MSTTEPFRLFDEARSALTTELFARWEADNPGSHKCFAGSDRDLVDAVERLRAQQERERG